MFRNLWVFFVSRLKKNETDVKCFLDDGKMSVKYYLEEFCKSKIDKNVGLGSNLGFLFDEAAVGNASTWLNKYLSISSGDTGCTRGLRVSVVTFSIRQNVSFPVL